MKQVSRDAPYSPSPVVTGVLGFVPERFVSLLERRGEPTSGLFDGLGFGREDLTDHRSRVPWDDFAMLADRVHARIGDEVLLAAAEETISTYEAYAPLAALVVEPSWLYAAARVINEKLYGGNARMPIYEWLDDGRLHVVVEVLHERRGCFAYMLASVGAFRAIAQHIGLPPADVEATLDAKRSEYWVTLPASQSLVARSAALVARTRERFVERFLDNRAVDLLVSAAVPPEPVEHDPELLSMDRGVLERAATAMRLTPRQQEVLAHLAEGRTNKDIAKRLSLAERTVELHVTTILRKARASSRAELVTRALRRFSRTR